MNIPTTVKMISLVAAGFLLSSCLFSIDGKGLSNNLYCDNFLIYDMCAADPNNDGVVDYVYFTDTEEVFMFSETGLPEKPEAQPMHRCAQMMEPDLVETTSKLFYINDETPALAKSDIRGAMMLKYFTYLPEITACNMRAEEAEKAAQNS